MEAFERLLRYGIKPSVQRMAIMEYLMGNETHPTVDDIYLALSTVIPTLSKTTVYNTLKLFASHKAIQILTISEKNACFDPYPEPHSHFLCKECNKIYNLTDKTFHHLTDAIEIEGHAIDEIHCYYKGKCKECRESVCAV